jgi:addiction module HigA family antidote
MVNEVKMEQEERLPPVHPGEVLLEDFMKPLGLSQYRLAQDLNVPAIRISQIVHGKRAVTADTALRLARYFGTSANVWMRLQARYDLEVAEAELTERVKREVKTRPNAMTPKTSEDADARRDLVRFESAEEIFEQLVIRETPIRYENEDTS